VIVLLAAAVWAGLVLVPAWWHRPSPARVRALVPEPERRPASQLPGAAGRAIRHTAGRPADPVADLRLGWSVLLGVVAAIVSPPLGLLVGVGRWGWPLLRARQEQRQAAEAVVASLPDLIDLLAVAVGAGLTVPLALAAVGPRLTGPLGSAVAEVQRRTSLGVPRTEALESLCQEVGEVARPLVAALQGAERYGTPLAPALERLAAEARLRRRRLAEAAARRTPVRLLFPLVLCTLPAFALLTVVPLLAGSLSSLRP
jgi:tight adherence protein C